MQSSLLIRHALPPDQFLQTSRRDACCFADLDRFEFAVGYQLVEFCSANAYHTGSVIDPDADRLNRLMPAHSAGSSSR